MTPRASRLIALAAATLVAAGAAFAQTPAPQRAISADSASGERRSLETARESLKGAEEQRARIAAEIEALKGERGRLQTTMADVVASIREKEPAIASRGVRIGELAESERQLKASLVARRGVLAEVIAALQRMGRQPPPALLVRPDDALEALRSAILLGAVVPDMRAEAEALGSDLREMARLKDMLVGERDALSGEIEQLGQEQERLSALVDERQRRLGRREGDLESEGERIAAIGRDVGGLEELIRKMEQDQARTAADEAAKAKAKAEADAATSAKVELAALSDPKRLAPAAPFDKMRGLLPLPVSGKRLKGFGDADGSANGAMGASFSTTEGAPVTAPADGWVVYAGPFRSYGKLLILNAGGGYHILLAGMERITVGLNQFVLAGEPVAMMRGEAATAGKSAGGTSAGPVLYVEFRKDRDAIDPQPWWAGSGEKVGG